MTPDEQTVSLLTKIVEELHGMGAIMVLMLVLSFVQTCFSK